MRGLDMELLVIAGVLLLMLSAGILAEFYGLPETTKVVTAGVTVLVGVLARALGFGKEDPGPKDH